MAEQLFSLKMLLCLSPLIVITKAFKTVSLAVNPKYCPNLIIIMCLDLDLGSPTL